MLGARRRRSDWQTVHLTQCPHSRVHMLPLLLTRKDVSQRLIHHRLSAAWLRRHKSWHRAELIRCRASIHLTLPFSGAADAVRTVRLHDLIIAENIIEKERRSRKSARFAPLSRAERRDEKLAETKSTECAHTSTGSRLADSRAQSSYRVSLRSPLPASASSSPTIRLGACSSLSVITCARGCGSPTKSATLLGSVGRASSRTYDFAPSERRMKRTNCELCQHFPTCSENHFDARRFHTTLFRTRHRLAVVFRIRVHIFSAEMKQVFYSALAQSTESGPCFLLSLSLSVCTLAPNAPDLTRRWRE